MSTRTPEANSASTTAADMNTILLLSLNKRGFWDEQHSSLVDALASKARLKLVAEAPDAVTYLTNNAPSAILITDEALTLQKPEFDAIRDKVVQYVRDGGIAVICTHFNSCVVPSDLNWWFKRIWRLPWKKGDYQRTTVYLNPESCGARFAGIGLPAQYSLKAVFLKNVAKHAATYLPSNESRIESAVFGPEPVDVRQTPVVFEMVGRGWLGYVGDVNNETQSQAVILAMCGL